MNYYRIKFGDPSLNDFYTVGVRAVNMISAMQTIVDEFQSNYILEFYDIKRDDTVTKVFQSEYRKQLKSNLTEK